MEDYRVRIGWRTHPKRQLLEATLGRDAVLAVMDLWEFCAANPSRSGGDLCGMSNRAIAVAAGWKGDASAFIEALTDPEIALLDGEPGAYLIHDWDEHNPYVAGHGGRRESASAKSHTRWHKAGKHAGRAVDGCQQCQLNAPALPQHPPAMPVDAGRNPPDPDPSPVPVPVPDPKPMKASAQNARGGHEEKPPHAGDAEHLDADALIAAVRQWPDWVTNTKPDAVEAKARAMAPFTRDEVRFARAQAQNDPGKPSLGLLLAKVDFQRKGAAKKPTGVPERNATAPPKRPPPTPRSNEPRFQGASIAAVKRLVADLVEEKAAPP